MGTRIQKCYGVGGPLVDVFPAPIQAQRPPVNGQDVNYPQGQEWWDNSASTPVQYFFNDDSSGTWSTGGNAAASTTVAGIVRLATIAETQAGTSQTIATTPAGVAALVLAGAPDATQVTKGISYLATNADVVTPYNTPLGTNTVLTPANITTFFASPPSIGSTAAGTGSFTTLAASGLSSLSGSATILTAGTALNLGSDNDASAVNLAVGTTARTVGIANSSAAHVVTVGSTTGAASLTLQAGTGNMALTGAVTTTITIGKSDGTGTITLGSSSGSQTVNIAAGAGQATVAIGGGTAGNTISIGNGANTVAQTINIAAGASAGNSTVNILSGNGSAGTQTANILTGTRAGAVNMGTNAAHILTIGSTTGAASTTIKGGSGGIVLTPTSGNISMAPSTQSVASPTASATQNTRLFTVTFTGFTTAAAGTQDFTINNTTVTTSSGVLLSIANLNASTNNAQMTILGVTQAANSLIVHTKNNGAGALGAGDNVLITGWVIS